jgi:hypothetical protein
MSKDSEVSVVVSGDVTKDCNIAILKEKAANKEDWNTVNYARVSMQRGSVLMLADLLRSVAKSSGSYDKKADFKKLIACPQDYPDRKIKTFPSFFAKWEQFPQDNKKTEKVWRVREFLGFQKSSSETLKFSKTLDNPKAKIVVLDDGNLDFRRQEKPENWTKALLKKEKPWVVVKMCSPIAEGNLWEYLYKNHTKKLIAVLTIDDLRLTKVQISRELSWELTAQDLVRELIYNPAVNALSQCAFVIILFSTDGAILLEKPASDKIETERFAMPQCHLIFDPECIEGMWRNNHEGGMIGYKTCLTASVVQALWQKPDKPEIKEAVKRGLSAMRELLLNGYENKSRNKETTELVFPTKRIAEFLVKSPEINQTFAEAEIPPPQMPTDSADKPEFWTILAGRYAKGEGLKGVAREIVLKGAKKALQGVPLGKFGALTTVDRREIEGFRSIGTLVAEYAKTASDKPLSIAVFGAPGAGKSFGIKQLAKDLLRGKIAEKTFNLSQFSTTAELCGALHQVRDIGLSGKLPLVFWDEFDSTFKDQPLGWLRYFLAPMQDGEFQDGQITHPIGRAIFVFAGGTAESMNDFEQSFIETPKDSTPNLEEKKLEGIRKQKEAKLPDFISRLKGFVNILGPNPTKSNEGQKNDYYLIRRAILLRSLLKRDTPQFFDKDGQLSIDNGVLRALLETEKYKHGVRSMESVIAMSLTEGKTHYERSALPSQTQLNLHVDAEEFLYLVNMIDFEGDLLEKLAEYLHEKIYPPIFEYTPEPYQDLNEHQKELNRGFIKDIHRKLNKCNCLAVAGDYGGEDFKFTAEEIENLAKMEHKRWLEEKIESGFCYAADLKKAEQQNPNGKFNKSMLFWDKSSEDNSESYQETVGKDELPDKVKENNRDLIKSIPDILNHIRYKIVGKTSRNMIKIGVTGHRFLAELDKIDAALEEVLSRIEESFPDQSLTILSSLAEGADRLAAHHVLKRKNARLFAVLPFHQAEYETDFETPESKAEFRQLLSIASKTIVIPQSKTRNEAYKAAGKYVLENCDVLLTIWDGQGAQGQGGTGEIVALARKRKIPIAWIHAGNRKPGTSEPTSLGNEQGMVEFENL